MTRFWKNLPRRQQNVLIAVFAALLAGWFFLVETPRIEKKLRALAAQIDIREKGRRASQPAQKPAAPAGDPVLLARERRELEARVPALAERVKKKEARLAPLDDPAAQQRLQLALAKLAQGSDVEMESLRLIDEETRRGARDESLVPTVERLRGVLGNEFRRPLYLFKARASYRGLMQVLDGLGRLEHAVVPVNLAVTVQAELAPHKEGARERQIRRQWLDVQLILAF